MRPFYRAIVATAVVGLVACGDDDSNKDSNPNNVNNSNNTNNLNNSNNANNTNNTNNLNNSNNAAGTCHLLEYDSNGDGTPNVNQVVEYDADGNPFLEQTDVNRDGGFERIVTRTFDANGNPTRLETTNAQGEVLEIVIQAFDSESRQTLYRRDGDADGNDDIVIETEYDMYGNSVLYRIDGRQGPNGMVIRIADGAWDVEVRSTFSGPEIPTSFAVDTDANGQPNAEGTWSYDGDGNLTGFRQDGVYVFQTGTLLESADGTDDLVVTNTYTNNQLVELSQDGFVNGQMTLTKADGTPDFVQNQFLYDTMGRPVEYVTDGRRAKNDDIVETADGTPDGKFSLTYEGASTEPATFSYDLGLDDQNDTVITTTRNSDGRPLTVEYDGETDAQNNVTAPADGTVNRREVRTFNADGEVLTFRLDADADGTDDFVLEREINGNGDNTLVRTDGELAPGNFYVQTSADGTWDSETITSYDAMNRITSFEQRNNGSTATAGTWTYGMCDDFR